MPVVRVAIYKKNLEDPTALLNFCTGTLISENQVLTARGCLNVSTDEVKIFVLADTYAKGTIRLDSNKNIITAPNDLTWAQVTTINDFCLEQWCRQNTEFQTSSPLNEPAQLSILATVAEDAVVLNLNKKMGVDFGFFKIHESSNEDITSLSIAGFPLESNAGIGFTDAVKHLAHDCELKNSEAVEAVSYSNCIMVRGMEGGPLFYVNENGEYFLVGLLSMLFRSPDLPETGISLIQIFDMNKLRRLLDHQ